MNDTFKNFDQGFLRLTDKEIAFADLAWNQHPAFAGVALKHLLTGKDTDGRYSYHLVRIAPNSSIGDHIHATQLETHEVIAGSGICINNGTELSYTPGTISVMPAGIHHEVNAGGEGLYLFAKFMPALL